MTDVPDTLPIASTASSQRFLLAQLERLTLVFPSALVAEILLIERSQILPLPFYNPAILGCVHHAGQIVPLIAVDRQLGLRAASLTREMLTVVRLSEAAENVAGVGAIVDRVIGSQTKEQLAPEVFQGSVSSTMRLFEPCLFGKELFTPLRWQVGV